MNEGQNKTENNRQVGLGHIRFEGGVAETTTSDNDRSIMLLISSYPRRVVCHGGWLCLII